MVEGHKYKKAYTGNIKIINRINYKQFKEEWVICAEYEENISYIRYIDLHLKTEKKLDATVDLPKHWESLENLFGVFYDKNEALCYATTLKKNIKKIIDFKPEEFLV